MSGVYVLKRPKARSDLALCPGGSIGSLGRDAAVTENRDSEQEHVKRRSLSSPLAQSQRELEIRLRPLARGSGAREPRNDV